MAGFDTVLQYIPEVAGPTQKHLSFKEKLKWTGLVLVLFFILGAVPLVGLGENALSRFEFLSVVLGASFGSIISLGIGPIVTASIVLQLLNGSGLLNFDLKSAAGKAAFQGTQKLLTYFFIILEAAVYVLMGGLAPAAGVPAIALIIQLCIGGLIIIFLDEIVSKWGFGSGISLFIAAGVSQRIFTQIFSPLHRQVATGVFEDSFVGAIPELFRTLSAGDSTAAGLVLLPLIATLIIFAIVVFAQAMKVEIPLSFGRIRGHGVRWPLNFIYTNVLPVILVSALLANLQLLGTLFSSNKFFSSLSLFLSNQNLLQNILIGNASFGLIMGTIGYLLFYIFATTLFSWFWMQTARLDPRSQAEQMMASGLQIPGFRKDIRVLERLLKRYIYPLTIMGGMFIGFLAGFANLTGAFGSGTGLLLTVMIIYKLYEDIAKQHLEDMNPMLRKMVGK
ncbi:MAG: preprotein translocase subunit SecY [Nanoarchaeota archaeon]|nr:preprotein translocase subunit SecY [Nanoarchaeota archaeon]